jgi:integrase
MKLIQEWLGHSDMATTANIYSHVDSASKKVTGDVIGGVLG